MKQLLLMMLCAAPAVAQLADRPGRGVDVEPDRGASAAKTTEARRTLEAWFAGYEFVPTAAHYARLGERLEPALLAIARDPAVHPLVQARAVSAMVHAAGAATEDALVGMLSDPDAASLLRRKAALVLAERSGARYLDLLVSAFGAAGDDVLLREACARALRTIGPPAYAARDTLYRETHQPTVKALLGETKRIGVDR